MTRFSAPTRGLPGGRENFWVGILGLHMDDVGFYGVIQGYRRLENGSYIMGFRDVTPTKPNQMEERVQREMEAGIILKFIIGFILPKP